MQPLNGNCCSLHWEQRLIPPGSALTWVRVSRHISYEGCQLLQVNNATPSSEHVLVIPSLASPFFSHCDGGLCFLTFPLHIFVSTQLFLPISAMHVLLISDLLGCRAIFTYSQWQFYYCICSRLDCLSSTWLLVPVELPQSIQKENSVKHWSMNNSENPQVTSSNINSIQTKSHL